MTLPSLVRKSLQFELDNARRRLRDVQAEMIGLQADLVNRNVEIANLCEVVYQFGQVLGETP